MARRSNIRQRGRSWEAFLRVNGKQVSKTCRTRDEAELWLARQLERRAHGREPERQVRVTFKEAAEAWYRDRGQEKNWSPSTRRDYRSALDVHLLPAFEDVQLSKMTPGRIEAWRREAMTPYLDVKGELHVRLPRRTAQKCLAMLHGIFEHARKAYGLQSNPAADVEQIRHTYDGSIDFYSPEEVRALVRAAASADSDGAEQDAAIFLTAAFAGLRRGELVALRVRDVDFPNRVLRIEGSYVLGELKAPKSGKVRSVPMAFELEQALARLLTERGNPGPDELVFPGEGGGYLDASALRRRYEKAQRKAGLRKLRFHDLRHTFGSNVINRASLVDVQAWLGHADIKTTMRYLHHKSQAAAADILDAAFGPADPLESASALPAEACAEGVSGASEAQTDEVGFGSTVPIRLQGFA
jgi:integrase